MLPDDQIAIPKGSTVLVTGANGYVGSAVADATLAAGYNVRASVRNIERAKWLQEVFDEKYGPGKFELVEVPEPLKEDALVGSLDGISAIAHVATVIPLSHEPDPYIPDVTALTMCVLKSAAKAPSVKRVVITSSSMAAVDPAPNVERTVTNETWNEKALKEAWKAPFGPDNLWNVYGASKANAEREAWKWVEANKPHFALNAVLPNTNFGPTVSRKYQGFGSTASMLKQVYDGSTEPMTADPPQYFVDVRDTARLHVIALVGLGVENERLWAFGAPYNWNVVLGILRKMFPERPFPSDIPGLGTDIGRYPRERAEAFLRSYGQLGFASLEQSIADTMTNL